MKVAIRYYTKSGNTKKLAEAIAKAINIPAESTDVKLTEKVDILFLGSSVYAAGVDKKVVEFIESNKDMIGKIVNFSTAAVLPSTYKQVSKLAEEKDIVMAEEEFHCKGSFMMMHKGRPNQADCEAVAAFVKKIIE